MATEQGKTRRRFLADMLFLGGGLTAAGLLAKSQLFTPEPEPEPEPEPPLAGAVVAPGPSASGTPVPTCSETPPQQLPPEVEGKMTLPEPECEKPTKPADPFGKRESPAPRPSGPQPAHPGLVAPPRPR